MAHKNDGWIYSIQNIKTDVKKHFKLKNINNKKSDILLQEAIQLSTSTSKGSGNKIT